MFTNLTNWLTLEFMQDFCSANGSINRDKLVFYYSESLPNIVKAVIKKTR